MKTGFFNYLAKTFEKLSGNVNHYEGMRENAALDVLAGPSPSKMMPEPVGLDIPEGAELPMSEDWEALYGPVAPLEDTPDDEAYGGESRESDGGSADKDAGRQNRSCL